MTILPDYDLGLNWPAFAEPRLRPATWPGLPYDDDHLEPVLSEDLLAEHARQFAAGYGERWDEALRLGRGGRRNLEFAWGGLVLHHLYFWGMRDRGSRPEPDGPLDRFLSYGGGVDGWTDVLRHLASTQQGSGWLVLGVSDTARLRPILLPNHDLAPLRRARLTPLVVVDLWEHAYVPDYRTRRDTYVSSTLRDLVDWRLADDRLQAALARSSRATRVRRS